MQCSASVGGILSSRLHSQFKKDVGTSQTGDLLNLKHAAFEENDNSICPPSLRVERVRETDMLHSVESVAALAHK